MAEAEIYDLVQSVIKRFDREAAQLIGRPALSKVVRDHQPGPRPTEDYGLITILSDRVSSGMLPPNYSVETVDGEQRVVQHQRHEMEYLIRLTVFSKISVDYLQSIVAAVQSNRGTLLLWPYTVRRVSTIFRAPLLVQSEFEGQAYVDITLAGWPCEPVVIDVIETVPLEQEGHRDNLVVTSKTSTIIKP